MPALARSPPWSLASWLFRPRSPCYLFNDSTAPGLSTEGGPRSPFSSSGLLLLLPLCFPSSLSLLIAFHLTSQAFLPTPLCPPNLQHERREPFHPVRFPLLHPSPFLPPPSPAPSLPLPFTPSPSRRLLHLTNCLSLTSAFRPCSPDFLAGLEAAGYLQRLDTSETRITARFQHSLTKMNYASLSMAFLEQAGVRAVHRSVVQFFNEEPTSDPYVHVMVGALPAPVPAKISGVASWIPIQSDDEAPGTSHWTVNVDGFWPLTVVYDVNQSHLFHEDRVSLSPSSPSSSSRINLFLSHSFSPPSQYPGIRSDQETDDDAGAYPGAGEPAPLPSQRRRRGGQSSSYNYDAPTSGYYSASDRRGSAYARQPSYGGMGGDESASSGSDSDDGGAGGAAGVSGNGRSYYSGGGAGGMSSSGAAASSSRSARGGGMGRSGACLCLSLPLFCSFFTLVSRLAPSPAPPFLSGRSLIPQLVDAASSAAAASSSQQAYGGMGRSNSRAGSRTAASRKGSMSAAQMDAALGAMSLSGSAAGGGMGRSASRASRSARSNAGGY